MAKRISLVIPAYNEEDCVDELGTRLAAVFDAMPDYEWEAVIVENGSDDATLSLLEDLHRRDSRFKVLQLARNFKMDGGLTAGLQYATGDAVILMTADLQDPPEVIPEFVAKWEEGYDHVYGQLTARVGTGPIRKLNSNLFYLIAGRLTDGRIPRNVSDFRLIDRKMVDVINQMDERNRFMRGLFAWVGFRSAGVKHERPPRHGGESKALTFGVLEFAVKGIFAHSYIPLRLAAAFGFLLSALSIVALIVLTVRFLIGGVPFPGFGTIICLTILLFGFLFLTLGIVAEYVGLIYEEVKRRPNFIVRQAIGMAGPPSRRVGDEPEREGAAPH